MRSVLSRSGLLAAMPIIVLALWHCTTEPQSALVGRYRLATVGFATVPAICGSGSVDSGEIAINEAMRFTTVVHYDTLRIASSGTVIVDNPLVWLRADSGDSNIGNGTSDSTALDFRTWGNLSCSGFHFVKF